MPRIYLIILCFVPALRGISPANIIAPTRDTRIAAAPSNGNNYGGSTTIAMNNDSKMLMYFDLTGMSESITSATLRINQVSGFATGTRTMDAFNITDANDAWIEGTSSGAASPGEPTWDFRAFSTTAWAGSAGLSTPGVDYINTVIGTYSTTVTGGWWEVDLDVAEVELWRTTPAQNNGLLLTFSADGGSDFFATRENGDSGNRPELVLLTIPEPASAVLFLVPVAAGVIRTIRNRRPKAPGEP